jgi:hypothetical protein
MSIGLATTPAHAAPLGMSSQITYHPVSATDNHVYVVDIQGLVTMSQAAAQDSINHGYSIELRYWGDDPDSDDLLAGPVKPQIVSAAAEGLHFQHSRTFSIFSTGRRRQRPGQSGRLRVGRNLRRCPTPGPQR